MSSYELRTRFLRIYLFFTCIPPWRPLVQRYALTIVAGMDPRSNSYCGFLTGTIGRGTAVVGERSITSRSGTMEPHEAEATNISAEHRHKQKDHRHATFFHAIHTSSSVHHSTHVCTSS